MVNILFCQRGPWPNAPTPKYATVHVAFHMWNFTNEKLHVICTNICRLIHSVMWNFTCENSFVKIHLLLTHVQFHMWHFTCETLDENMCFSGHVCLSWKKITCAFGTSHKIHVLFLLVSQLMSCRPPITRSSAASTIASFLQPAAVYWFMREFKQVRAHARTYAHTHAHTHTRTHGASFTHQLLLPQERWQMVGLFIMISAFKQPLHFTIFFTIMHSIIVSGIQGRHLRGLRGRRPLKEKEKRKKERKKKKKEKREKRRKKERKKGTMNNVKLLHIKCCFFPIFQ